MPQINPNSHKDEGKGEARSDLYDSVTMYGYQKCCNFHYKLADHVVVLYDCCSATVAHLNYNVKQGLSLCEKRC